MLITQTDFLAKPDFLNNLVFVYGKIKLKVKCFILDEKGGFGTNAMKELIF